MLNFSYCNPTRIIFGKDTISQLSEQIPAGSSVLLLYGGGSIKKNGVYDQVKQALADYEVLEFGGIEPNPHYKTCMEAVGLARENKVDFLLAVGGGSVLDGTKFIAAAACYDGEDPWDILCKAAEIKKALPLGCVMTLPATGSEMNGTSVISNIEAGEKLFFSSEAVFPKFSILDPQTTFSLSTRQTENGIVDAFVHVAEQYLTYNVNSPLQDRQSEAILSTLIEEGPRVLAQPNDYDARANIMWCACQALNGLIGSGIVHDWASHMIGHELTALYGLDHAQSLAIVLPGVLAHQAESKKGKLLQCGRRVWGIDSNQPEEVIQRIEDFYISLGMKTRLSDYQIPREACSLVADRLAEKEMLLGEHQCIDHAAVVEILELRY